MLETLTLTNFRQFSDKTVVFGAGSTSVRGANEGGKSTIIEGFLYLLGGAKACRNSDFVLWGAKPNSVKVEALMTLQGTQVRATRGKSGAEIYVPHNALAPTVTGQSEVTAWFAEQLGASLDVVAKMCFAGQKEIGGLLDEGNSKVVEFIEDMSGLDIVEFFIGKIQATGKVGATTALVERANNDRLQLEAQQHLSYAENIEATEAAIDPLVVESATLADAISSHEEALKADREVLRASTQHASSLAAAQRTLDRAGSAVLDAGTTLENAQKALAGARADSVIEAELEAAQDQQRDSDAAADKLKVKRAFDAWPAPEAEWDEGVEALQAFVTTNRQLERDAGEKIRTLESDIGKLRQNIAVANSKKVTASACGLCGKDVSKLPEVKKQNDALDAEIAANAEQAASGVLLVADLQAHRAEARENAEAGDALLKAPFFDLALTRPQWFEVDKQYVPFRAKWIGGDVENIAAPEVSVTRLKAERAARQTLERHLASATATLESARTAADTASKHFMLLSCEAVPESEETINARIATRDAGLTEKRLTAFKLAQELGNQQGLLKSLRNAAQAHDQHVANLTAALAKTEKDLELYEFHNQLIEDLRKARPVVANRLWSMVLLSVSTYLTRMRGEPSIVERHDKTFVINGRPSTSYSGSALDLLALGIRVALTKVFVPGADMLILDEPFAACSEERTLQCLAFTVAAGFEQTILITHEAGTEQIFDNVVEV
jgi:hypothetical protein